MCPPCLNLLTKKAPYKGLSADSEEKHEPVSDIDTAAADSLKVLDPKRPIREADILLRHNICRGGAQAVTAIGGANFPKADSQRRMEPLVGPKAQLPLAHQRPYRSPELVRRAFRTAFGLRS
jgi:hypothetical protein